MKLTLLEIDDLMRLRYFRLRKARKAPYADVAQFYGFTPEDVAEVHYPKPGNNDILWFQLKDGRVIDGEGQPVASALVPALGAEPETKKSADPKMAALRVLVVDDQKIVLRQMLQMLHQAGVTAIDTAETSWDGAEKMSCGTYDIIFLDWYMSGKKGGELIADFRAAHPHDKTALVVVSAESRQSLVTEAKAAGATSYVVKPFRQADIQEQLEKCIAGRKEAG